MPLIDDLKLPMTERDENRREFLAVLGAGLCAPAILRARPQPKRYRIAFSTLGCPAWSWTTTWPLQRTPVSPPTTVMARSR